MFLTYEKNQLYSCFWRKDFLQLISVFDAMYDDVGVCVDVDGVYVVIIGFSLLHSFIDLEMCKGMGRFQWIRSHLRYHQVQ